MTYLKPGFHHPDLERNELGYTKNDYESSLSTLCAGCGHDSISAAVVTACHEMAIAPHKVAKVSGIGCSSKTPTYFLGNSHGFNSVHGRMPSVATGASAANRDLTYIGVSGDGDSASIGMGQFAHVVRRNLDMLYLVENNGCYGLTKGQDSATADVGSKSKAGSINPYEPVDLVSIALQLGASFVARSFSGDKAQLVPLIKAAISHRGFALIDVISPCVTFNNNPGSTKSYEYTREHMNTTGKFDFVAMKEEITANYPPGSTREVTLHDGSAVHLYKMADDLDQLDRDSALHAVQQYKSKGQVLTGLIYMDPDSQDMHKIIDTCSKPLNMLAESDLCPGNRVLQDINDSLR